MRFGRSDGEVRSVPQRIAVTGAVIDRESGFRDFLRSYVWILVCILAALGLCLIVGLQFKWVGLVWSPVDYSIGAPAIEANGQERDRSTIEVKGPASLFSEETFVVDTGKTYELSAEVRILPKDDGTPQVSIVYFGVQTFDANGRELTSGLGTYRYAGANKRNVSSAEGWIHIGGLITGEGDSSHNQFRPGTHSVKLVLLPNYGADSEMVTLVRKASFAQRITLVPKSR